MAITTDDPLAAPSSSAVHAGSEFGGDPGLIQPEPHELTPSEKLHVMFAMDPNHIPGDPNESTHLDEAGWPRGRTEWG